MKYFTKYLPVEGEIQPNSWVQSPNDGEIWQLNGTKDAVGFAIESMQQLVKLFLCSRYIQVGDKVTGKLAAVFNYEELVVEELYEDGAMLGKPSEKYIAPSNDFYKVIGEISPEATWVKEGDEFDEDEVQAYFKPNSVPKEEWKSYSVLGKQRKTGKKQLVYPLSLSFSGLSWEIPVNPLTHKYKIKGPCGHFH